MWPKIDLGGWLFYFGLLGFCVLLFGVGSICTLIARRKKRLAAMRSGLPYIVEREQPAFQTLRTIIAAVANTIPAMIKIAVPVLCFVLGYETRDVVAYGQFTERRPANWEVISEYPASHYSGMAYDLRLSDGSTVSEFIPCENVGLHVGLKISRAGFYRKPECASFQGPRAYIVKERTDSQDTTTKGRSTDGVYVLQALGSAENRYSEIAKTGWNSEAKRILMPSRWPITTTRKAEADNPVTASGFLTRSNQ